jgi:hypothetical protein
MAIKKREKQHRADGWQQIDRLTHAKMLRGKLDIRSNSRASCHHQQCADYHQQDGTGQQPAVNCPPPYANQ